MYYCDFHIFSTNFKGPVWISELKVCQVTSFVSPLEDVCGFHCRVSRC